MSVKLTYFASQSIIDAAREHARSTLQTLESDWRVADDAPVYFDDNGAWVEVWVLVEDDDIGYPSDAQEEEGN